MSRMLKALQQIESTRPAPPPPPEPVGGQNEIEETLATAEQVVLEFEEGDWDEGRREAECGRRKAEEESTRAAEAARSAQVSDPLRSARVSDPAEAVVYPAERWQRFMAEPARGAASLSEQPAAPDRSCVSPLLRSSIRERGSRSPASPPTAAAPAPATPAPGPPMPSPARAATATRPAASRAGLGKLAGPLKGECAELGRIILGQLGLARPAAMLLTSSQGEMQRGMSLVSLATTLGQQTEGEVLLIGCDWQSKSAAQRYGITAERGLVDLLAGGGRGIKAVQKVGRPPISVLLGRGSASPPQLPKEFSWQVLIKQLKQRYSLVILDATGLACAQAAPIARHCDGAYLLVLARQTPRRAAARAVTLLSGVNARLLGCVLVTG